MDGITGVWITEKLMEAVKSFYEHTQNYIRVKSKVFHVYTYWLVCEMDV